MVNIGLCNSKTFESNVETTVDSSLNSATKEICEVKLTDSQNGDYVREYDKIVDYDESAED